LGVAVVSLMDRMISEMEDILAFFLNGAVFWLSAVILLPVFDCREWGALLYGIECVFA